MVGPWSSLDRLLVHYPPGMGVQPALPMVVPSTLRGIEFPPFVVDFGSFDSFPSVRTDELRWAAFSVSGRRPSVKRTPLKKDFKDGVWDSF